MHQRTSERSLPRKTTPKVVGGKVQRKNRAARTPNYYNTPQDVPIIDRRRPGAGHRHVLRKKDLVDFISILPDWDELSKGLNAVVLAPAEPGTAGWHDRGIVAICTWQRDLCVQTSPEFYFEHRDIFERIGVECEKREWGYLCKFTGAQVRAYQLLHIFLHELGHHHDRMTTRSQRDIARGEPYAEAYARQYEKLIWQRYGEVFSWD